jgi:transcriptional regulator with XRE-family HTH domain
MTLKELSIKLNINPTTVQRYESGIINPPLEKLMLLSSIFDCSIDYIIGLSDTKEIINDDKTDLKPFISANPKTKTIFLERLVDLMLDKDLNKDMLTKKTNIDINKIDAFVSGKQFPDIEELKIISEILNTTIDYMVGLNDNPSPDEIVILEDWIVINEGNKTRKISPDEIRKFIRDNS